MHQISLTYLSVVNLELTLNAGDVVLTADVRLSAVSCTVSVFCQLVYGQLAQQRQQTQAAQAQVSLVRHQLQAETAARLQAQRRSHQLLEHNRQLLQHVQQLVGELQQLQVSYTTTAAAIG